MIDAFLKVSDTGSRRDLFRSLGLVALGGGSAAVLAACSGSGSGSGAGSGDTAKSSGPVTIAKADVPQGSGVIKSGYIVTQPSAGTFQAFSNICTHQGCPISQIQGDTIMCNCHGSEFSVNGGTVKRGPASRPLTKAKITVDGSNLDVSGG